MELTDRALLPALRGALPGPAPHRIEAEALGDKGGGATLYRLRAVQPDGTARSYIVKRVASREMHVQRLIARAVPSVVPDIVATWPAGEDSFFLLMDEIGGAARPAAGPGAARLPGAARGGPFRAALRKLATIHERFLDATVELGGCGLVEETLNVADLSRRAQSLAGAIPQCAQLFDLRVDPGAMGALARLAASLPEAVAALRPPGGRTLVHGDFHLENIVVDREDRVRIIDWGSATIGVPAWDLVACGEPEIAWYLSARAALRLQPDPDGLFFDQLRASVICRMVQLLSAAMMSLLEQGPGIGAAIIPVCVGRLVEAWSEPAFRGGRGIRLVESKSESGI